MQKIEVDDVVCFSPGNNVSIANDQARLQYCYANASFGRGVQFLRVLTRQPRGIVHITVPIQCLLQILRMDH